MQMRFLGLDVPAHLAFFDTPRARKAIGVAHRILNQQQMPLLAAAQKAHDAKPSAKKLHIRAFVKSGVKGFSSYWKETPSDFVVREVFADDLCSGGSKSRLPESSKMSTPLRFGVPTTMSWYQQQRRRQDALATAADDDDLPISAPLNDRAVSTRDVERYGIDFAQQLERECETIVTSLLQHLNRRAHATSVSSSHLHHASRSARSRKLSTSVSSMLETKAQDITVVGKTSSQLVVDCCANNRELLVRVLLQSVFTWKLHDTYHAAALANNEIHQTQLLWVSVGAISCDRGVAQLPVSTCGSLISAGTNQQEGTDLQGAVSVLRNCLGEDESRRLLTFVGQVGVALSLSALLRTQENDGVTSPSSLQMIERAPSSLFVAWTVAASPQKVSQTSGAQLIDKSKYNNPRHRSDAKGRHLYKAQAQAVIAAVDQILTACHLTERAVRHWNTSSSCVWMFGDCDGLHMKVVVCGTPEADNKASPASSLIALNNTARGSQPMCAELAPRRTVLADVVFSVVEFELEKYGLPHSFVIQDIVEELQSSLCLLETERRRRGEPFVVVYEPEVHVSHFGAIDSRAHSFQRCRIRGVPLEVVKGLAATLEQQRCFEVNEDAVHHEGDLPDRADKLPKYASLSMSKRWKRNLPSRTPVGNSAASKSTSSTSLFDAAKAEERHAYWQQHFYKIHNPTLVWEDVVRADDVDSSKLEDGAGNSTSPKILSADDVEHPESKTSRLLQTSGGSRKRAMIRVCKEVEMTAKSMDLRLGALPPSSCDGGSAALLYDYSIRVGRIPHAEVDRASKAVSTVATKGFINYFGPSRFSDVSAKGAHPGLHLLRGEFQAAAALLVDPGDSFWGATKTLSKKNGHLATYREQRQKLEAEGDSVIRSVLRQALEFSTNSASEESCRDAFMNVIGPSVLRTIVNEFLAFVWNDVATQRCVRFGSQQVLEGDLVFSDTFRSDVGVVGGADRPPPRTKPAVTYVTRRDVEEQRYTMHDVLLPLPGFQVQLPMNETADLIIATLQHQYGIVFNPERGWWDIFGSPADVVEARRTSVGTSALPTTIVVEDDEALLLSSGGSGDIAAVHQVELPTTRFEAAAGNALCLSFSGGYRNLLWKPDRFQWKMHSTDAGTRRWFDHPKWYWEPAGGAATIAISCRLPLGVYPSMLIRELTKYDINHPDGVPVDQVALDVDVVRDSTKRPIVSWDSLRPDQQQLYLRHLNKKSSRKQGLMSTSVVQSDALSRALLYQSVFKSGGMRRSLLPSLRGRQDASY